MAPTLKPCGKRLRSPMRHWDRTPTRISADLVSWWWWTSWASATLRPDDVVTYTNNWPHEPLVGNKPNSSIFIWSFISIVLLIAGIGALAWFFLREREEWQKDVEPGRGLP